MRESLISALAGLIIMLVVRIRLVWALQGVVGGGGHNGVMFWTDPWDIRGWEMAEAFAKK